MHVCELGAGEQHGRTKTVVLQNGWHCSNHPSPQATVYVYELGEGEQVKVDKLEFSKASRGLGGGL